MSEQQVQIDAIEGQLQDDAIKIGSCHLRDLVCEAGREKLFLELEDLTVDYTRQPITLETLQKLFKLAEVKLLPNFMAELFAGELVNLTEHLPVSHFQLRSQEYQASIVYQKITHFAEAVRTNDAVKHVVNLGIGGSDLGPSMVTQGLAGFHDGPTMHYVSNIDPSALFDVLADCDPHSTLFIVTSKSFTTHETLANGALAKDWLEKNDADFDRAIVAVTANPQRALDWGININRIFAFDTGVGGRYSIWSAVGLPIMIAIGSQDFGAFLAGAHAMDQHVKMAPYATNLPVVMGLLRVWHRTYLGNMAYGLIPYDQRLSRLPAWAQQLEMESNGKGVDRLGDVLAEPAAPLIWGETGTNSQHSFFQWLHQGLDIVPIDILIAHKSAIMSDHVNWQANQRTLVINAVAQAEALAIGNKNTEEPHRHCPGNRPSLLISWDKTTPYALGRLMALYEYVTIISGFIWGVNSFDQWGVELGKKIADDIEMGRNLGQLSPAGRAFLKRLDQ